MKRSIYAIVSVVVMLIAGSIPGYAMDDKDTLNILFSGETLGTLYPVKK